MPTGTTLVVPPAHDRRRHPVPEGWTVAITPERPTLAPDDEITVTVVAAPPDGFSGRQAFNVNAFHEFGLAGGITLQVVAARAGGPGQ